MSDGVALSKAAVTSSIEIAKLLIEYKADVNMKPKGFNPPLVSVFERGGKQSLEFVKLLMDNGADCKVIDLNDIKYSSDQSHNYYYKEKGDLLRNYGCN